MAKLIDGRWVQSSLGASGAFHRTETRFRDHITSDGPHPPTSGRYHLYVSLACPWAHRTLMTRALLGLEDHVTVTAVDPFMTDEGWHFSTRSGCSEDPNLGATFLREVYLATNPELTSRVTVPVLWDRELKTIVSNESAEIVRMFDRVLAPALTSAAPLTPQTLQAEVDALTARFYNPVNNGVYRCGFARSQEAYETAFAELFAELDALDALLEGRDWLVGGRLTEADLFLFATLVRFDAVYYLHFKCNGRRIADYPNLQAHTERLLSNPAIAGTVRMDHIHEHYHRSHESINPHRILPRGPLDHFSNLLRDDHPSPVPGTAIQARSFSQDKLSEAQIVKALDVRTDWTRRGQRLVREWRFANYKEALGFVQFASMHAEKLNHHPDVELGWGRVQLSITTHDAGGLTELDLALVDAIDGR